MRFPILMMIISGVLLLAAPARAQQPSPPPPSQQAIQVRLPDGAVVWCEPAADGSGVYASIETDAATDVGKSAGRSFGATWGVALFLFGLLGQGMFMGRFALQWIASERSGRSVVPLGFWWLSLSGATILLIYFSLQAEPIGVLGQVLGWPIYLRNIYMVMRDRRSGGGDSSDMAGHPIADPNAEA